MWFINISTQRSLPLCEGSFGKTGNSGERMTTFVEEGGGTAVPDTVVLEGDRFGIPVKALRAAVVMGPVISWDMVISPPPVQVSWWRPTLRLGRSFCRRRPCRYFSSRRFIPGRFAGALIPATMILFFSLFCPFIWRLKDVETGADFKI